MSGDGYYSWPHRNNRLVDLRLVDKEWREDKLPAVDIQVTWCIVF